jgi:hypothetical protein
MKTAILIFMKIGKILKNVNRLDVFERQIKKSIRSFKNESIFKEKMKNFFVNKNLYSHLRSMLMKIETQDQTIKVNKDESSKSTVIIKDDVSIFGTNKIVSCSADYLTNLQPGYFTKNGIGRKSKFASTFNIRKKEKSKAELNLNWNFSTESESEANPYQIKRDNNIESEKVFKFDEFFRHDAPIILQRPKRNDKSGPYGFSFKNIFNFKKNSSDSVMNSISEKESFDNLSYSQIPLKMDYRAQKSKFTYETNDSLLTNGSHKIENEDKNFIKFFFEVSNSEIIKKMEKFLTDYLTLSKVQKESFSKSTIKRKSLQSVLSILKHSERVKEEGIFKKKNDKKVKNISEKKTKDQQIRFGLLKKAFKIDRKSSKKSNMESKSLELKRGKLSNFSK